MLPQRIMELAEVRVRYGYQRIHVLLRREGWQINHKRTYRLYTETGLSQRHKRPKRGNAAAHRVAREAPKAPNECWSMDFMSDQLFNGQRLQLLNIVDAYARECLAIEVESSIRAEHVVAALDFLSAIGGAPKMIRVDNGLEFVSKALDQWAYSHSVTLDFSRPGKPTDNAFIESFNGSEWDECLNANWFPSIPGARRKFGTWRGDYNERRPHTALNFLMPAEFVRLAGISAG